MISYDLFTKKQLIERLIILETELLNKSEAEWNSRHLEEKGSSFNSLKLKEKKNRINNQNC